MISRRVALQCGLAGAVSLTVPAMSSAGFLNIKLVIVGPTAAGKTSALVSYTTNRFPGEYLPSAFDNFSANIMHRGQPVNYGLWDTPGSESYDRIRPLSYPGADVFALAYDVSRQGSLDEAVSRFSPELRHHSPQTPTLLLGLKADLRERDALRPELFVTPDAIDEAMSATGADDHAECSALTQDNLHRVFDRMVELAAGMEPEAPAPGRRPEQLPDRFRPVERLPNRPRGGG
jgi:Ras-related C3 botulinum toxin substrate 1